MIIGIQWPPIGIRIINVYSIPILNTVLLLSSGVSITWSHHCIIRNYYTEGIISLIVTIILGWIFLSIQGYEYLESGFCIKDGIYGRVFLITTGFHGIHVFAGRLVLSYSLIIMINAYPTWNHHFSFECGAWYWHFVDIVWLIVFILLYVW
jgi:heme/copper-type cytochrome/quinol oxidase subunit 3